MNGVISEETSSGWLRSPLSKRDRDGIEAPVLDGTGLPLILTETSGIEFPLLNTTAIRVASIIDYVMAESEN